MLTASRRRLSAGEHVNPIPALRDIDQPFIFEIKFAGKHYRFEFFDTSSPDNWRLLDPDAIVICYDISQRLSLINMKRYVRFLPVNTMWPPALGFAEKHRGADLCTVDQ